MSCVASVFAFLLFRIFYCVRALRRNGRVLKVQRLLGKNGQVYYQHERGLETGSR